MLNKEERRLRASTAAHAGWARTPDRTARTQHGRDGLDRKLRDALITKIGEDAWAAMTPTSQEKALASARLVADIMADLDAEGLEPDTRESALLERTRQVADKIEAPEAAVAKAGLTFVDKDGVTRPSPILAELRSSSLVLARCLNGIQMDTGRQGKDPIKSKAGKASWAARSGGDNRGAIQRVR